MTKQQRQELNVLSRIVFGSSSRWHDIVNKGHIVPLLDHKGNVIPNHFVKVRPTVESAIEFMKAAGLAMQEKANAKE